jgi:PAS domain S-box-containing protein
LDFQAAQFIGQTHRELGFPEAQYRFWEEAVRGVFDSGIPFETEFTFECKQGQLVCNWRLVPERDAQGVVRSVLSIGRDITAHRRAEEDYRTLFREMLDGFALHQILCDQEGRATDYRFLAVNPAFERMTGLKAQDILGRTVREVMPGTERHWIETYGKVALTGEPASFENYHAGLRKHFEVTAFRPAPNQFACLFADITERKVLEAQLQQAQKMESIGRLAGGVAHDFNNLLTVINGYSQLLLAKLSAGDPMRANLEEIHKAGERAAGLTRQLLAFSRKQVLEPRVLDLNRVVEDMRPMLRRVVGEDMEMRVELHAKAGRVRADPHQLEQVVLNLVVNARDAMPDGGKLLIETAGVEWDENYVRSCPEARAGRHVMLAVSDNGVGMDEETRRQIFEPFFTTKETGQGTGLGLSMVQGIVAQSGGHINVYSEPGQGTTFKIYLPALDETGAEAGKPEDVPALGGKETVLVVEDQAEVRNYAAAVLHAYGYHVTTAENGGEALLIGERDGERIDLLLTDVVMPNVSGRELATRLEKMQPGIKVLFMSGYTDNVIAHHGVLEEGAEFLQKPFSPEQLAGKVRAVLGPPKRLARILVADEEAGVRGFLRKVLERGGYEVMEAVDGKPPLDEARAAQVDLVIADLILPEQEGIEFIRALRREMPGIGIIAISGRFQGPYLTMAGNLGADAMLAKPVGAELLLARVAQVLKLRR